ncbi:hypothetical protein [Acinetobacter baumannii]|uniref:hypothetical protein n=1 Tax=Acinetobacter baumannii TaxID=470 RepID=UPI000450EECB|nr:hypothetical protein [Acinetobacter baumannii]EXD15054.1 putative membrane protein [Acinetobacter baumannii 1297]
MKFAIHYMVLMAALYAISFPVFFMGEIEIFQTTIIWFVSVVICYPIAVYAKTALTKI